ncbi:unnamed protein product [Ectocarpus sp. 4 AP-2014]
MSRGGGRGGGRGGRGRSAPGAGQVLIRETQIDLGMDKVGLNQSEAPVRYPRMDLPGPIRILEDDVSHVAKQRELAADMSKSIYYITPKYAVKDVERYSDGVHSSGSRGQSLASQLSAGMKRHLPPELTDRPAIGTTAAGGKLPGLKPLPAFDGKSLTALEDRERKSAETGGAEKEKDKEDAGMLSDVEADVEEEEQDDDYAVDHYESGDDSGGDDEPAAVF